MRFNWKNKKVIGLSLALLLSGFGLSELAPVAVEIACELVTCEQPQG